MPTKPWNTDNNEFLPPTPTPVHSFFVFISQSTQLLKNKLYLEHFKKKKNTRYMYKNFTKILSGFWNSK